MPTVTTNLAMSLPLETEAADINVLNAAFQKVDAYAGTVNTTKANKKTQVAVTLLASGWGSTAPYQITVNVAGVTATGTDQYWSLIENPSQAQADAHDMARIKGVSQANGTCTLKAYGDKPTVDIPMIVEVVVK